VYTTQGDRFDTLAQQYYSDSSLWWIISIANTDKVNQSTIVIPEGLQIRIPSNYANVIQDFNIINA
jgi:phage tail protein X